MKTHHKQEGNSNLDCIPRTAEWHRDAFWTLDCGQKERNDENSTFAILRMCAVMMSEWSFHGYTGSNRI